MKQIWKWAKIRLDLTRWLKSPFLSWTTYHWHLLLTHLLMNDLWWWWIILGQFCSLTRQQKRNHFNFNTFQLIHPYYHIMLILPCSYASSSNVNKYKISFFGLYRENFWHLNWSRRPWYGVSPIARTKDWLIVAIWMLVDKARRAQHRDLWVLSNGINWFPACWVHVMTGHMTVYGSFYQNDQYRLGWVITYIQTVQRACGYLHCPASNWVKKTSIQEDVCSPKRQKESLNAAMVMMTAVKS